MTISPAPEANAVIAPASVSAIPASVSVIPASVSVIPAKAGIHWPAALLAALLALPAAPAAAEELGRLFFTPERRAALERQRQLNIQETRQVIEGATLSVSGVVRRSGGRTTTWVNGAQQDDQGAASGVRIEVDPANPGKTTVVAGEETPAALKVGEAINRATRETTTGVGEGRISVKRGSEPK